VLLVVSVAGTAWAFTTEPSREGLGEWHEPVSAPVGAGEAPAAVGYYQASALFGIDIETHGIVVGYGGAVRVGLNNSHGASDMHVVTERIIWLGGIVEKDLSVSVDAGEVGDLGLLWLPGPNFEGDQEYRVSLRILILQGTAWRYLGTSGDQWTDFQPGTLPVGPTGDESELTRKTNPYSYYDRANALMEAESSATADAVTEATDGLPGSLTFEKLCAAFDWVSREVSYVSEPGGEDDWQTPQETLQMRGGDCEDFALLIADMVLVMGGTPRMYLIDEHAFAAVWVGADSGEADEAIRGYYGAELKLAFIEEPEGFWVVADPLGSSHLGGLAVGAEPTSSSEWGFVDTRMLYGIDMTREPGSVQLWEIDKAWAIFQLVCDGIFVVAVALHADGPSVPSCARCGRPVTADDVRCPSCGATHHPFCASQGPCASCGFPMMPPRMESAGSGPEPGPPAPPAPPSAPPASPRGPSPGPR
jgi:hypothetical protein